MSDDDLSLAEQEQELPAEVEEKKRKGQLRTGYTTGTTATAATKAALLALLGKEVREVQVSLPKGKTATLKVAWTQSENGRATSAAVKDGGDDPDVTHGAEICSTVSFNDKAGAVNIDGGQGVGRVTKPGLGLEVGRAAINPTPMAMLKQAVEQVAGEQIKARGVDVVISVPKGEELAKKTDNPRLGIMGGISILGTTGIVLPYSTASFAAAIRQSLDVAIAAGADSAILTTGGRSEDFAKAMFDLPEHCFVQMGDFAGYSVRQAAAKKMRRVVMAGFIGKLTKMAMGVKQTHVRGSHVDMEFMAGLAESCGANQKVLAEIRQANTARHVGEIITKNNIKGFYDLLCRKVHEQMSEYSGGRLDIEVIMFDFDGRVLARYTQARH
ncbi:cobalt-precorrin-5B (C(1))-methyltransferase [Nitrososphaera sp.]|uniref:cobalt-precorrin-5B (C(1))-methyltransferase n=1 Tax=Nitrososphaera sp. TaxID=1971748 RepID=UPI0017F94EE8|nr:cobalt-precorrin-5B (C(1))-methyltransferase [Nitrososphaera sp.]NWG36051.1 cobalt-precorrin-5B (C(1))-methyltransferase [Nitrososphaera sp.]